MEIKTTSGWQQVVLMNESLNHWLIQFVQKHGLNQQLFYAYVCMQIKSKCVYIYTHIFAYLIERA